MKKKLNFEKNKWARVCTEKGVIKRKKKNKIIPIKIGIRKNIVADEKNI